jgi:hypothetical protein
MEEPEMKQPRASVMDQLAQLNLDLYSQNHVVRHVRAYGDARLTASASASASDDVIEFGLTERQGDATSNLLHCSLDVEEETIWITGESHAEIQGMYATDDTGMKKLCAALDAMRDAMGATT